jgi:hypothetical protein
MEQPAKPSAGKRRLRDDPDNITLWALRKAPRRGAPIQLRSTFNLTSKDVRYGPGVLRRRHLLRGLQRNPSQ